MSPEWGSPNGPRAHPPRLFRLDLLLSTAGMGDLKAAVQRALSEGRIYTCWVVKAEVLVGAKDEEGFVTLLDNLRALPEIPVTGKLWEAAAA
ncbi:MAG TPA: hypothetical protein PKY84_03330 [Thermosynergistes sp.]|nr:hypothetical protein [Thermosynergistes sp.]